MSEIESKLSNLHVRRHIGEKIKQRRKSLSLTQPELAMKLGISAHQLFKYESGVNRVSTEKLMLLSKILNVSPNFFYQGLAEFRVPGRELTLMCRNEEGKQFRLKLIDDDHIFSEIRILDQKPQSKSKRHEEN